MRYWASTSFWATWDKGASRNLVYVALKSFVGRSSWWWAKMSESFDLQYMSPGTRSQKRLHALKTLLKQKRHKQNWGLKITFLLSALLSTFWAYLRIKYPLLAIVFDFRPIVRLLTGTRFSVLLKLGIMNSRGEETPFDPPRKPW
jgi:hypothetical protein